MLAHAVALNQRALETVSLEDGSLAFVLADVMFVTLHRDGVETHRVKIGSFQHRLLGALGVKNPQVHVLDIELLEEHPHRQALHSGQVLDARLVVVNLPVPLLDKRFGHELNKPTHRNHTLTGVMQQSGLTAQGAVHVDSSGSVALQVGVILRIGL